MSNFTGVEDTQSVSLCHEKPLQEVLRIDFVTITEKYLQGSLKFTVGGKILLRVVVCGHVKSPCLMLHATAKLNLTTDSMANAF